MLTEEKDPLKGKMYFKTDCKELKTFFSFFRKYSQMLELKTLISVTKQNQ